MEPELYIKIYYKCDPTTVIGGVCEDCNGTGYIEDYIPCYIAAGNTICVRPKVEVEE